MEHSTRTLVRVNDMIVTYRLTEGEVTQLEGFILHNSDLLIEYEPGLYDADMLRKAVNIVVTRMKR